MDNIEKTSVWKAYRFPLILLLGIVIGSVIGINSPEFASKLKPFGDIFINLLFTAVVPLVFLSISSAVSNMTDLKRLGKILRSLLLIFVVTGIIAAVIMIVVVNFFPPSLNFSGVIETAGEIEKVDVGQAIVNALTVNDFSKILSRSNMLPLIIFATIFAIAVTMTDKSGKISVALDKINQVFMKIVGIVMYYAPIGLGCYFANLIAVYGPELLGDYARTIGIYYSVSIIYFFVAFFFYSYWAGGGMLGVKVFFGNIFNPAVTSLATCSSLATMPVNLLAAKNMGVKKDVREIVLPIGATMHMDGTCLSSILKISFLFGVFGQNFGGIGIYLTAILISIFSAVGMSGVPGGGLIGEMLICSVYGFPPEAFPMIAAIGFLVDPPATMVNATGDSLASMMVTRLTEGKNWLKNKVESGEVEVGSKKYDKKAETV